MKLAVDPAHINSRGCLPPNVLPLLRMKHDEAHAGHIVSLHERLRDTWDFTCSCGVKLSVSGLELAEYDRSPLPTPPWRFDPHAPRPSFTKRPKPAV